MSILLKNMIRPYMAPAGDDGSDAGGGAVDRGDDFTPTGPDAVKTEPEVKDEPKDEPEAAAADEEADVDPDDPDGELAENEEKPKRKDQRIPLNRHKEILAKEREQRAQLEARLAQYEKGQQVASFNEDITKLEDGIVKMEADYNKALVDGEMDKANQLMRQIRTAERQITEAKNEMRVQASIAQATEQARYNVALERIEEAFPQINPDSDEFDKEQLTEVVEWKLFYEKQRNYTPTKALQEAVKKVLKPAGKAQEQATEVKPRVDPQDVAAERKKSAVAKTLDATKKTPPNTSRVGMDSNKAGGGLTAADVMKMTQEEFAKLPDDVLARMRGDVLA